MFRLTADALGHANRIFLALVERFGGQMLPKTHRTDLQYTRKHTRETVQKYAARVSLAAW